VTSVLNAVTIGAAVVGFLVLVFFFFRPRE
jgi:hypothetical protein